MIDLLIGLVAAMVANFLLGTNLATLKDEFDKNKMKSGLLKIAGIVLGVVAMLGCAYLTNDIMVININSQNVNLLDAMRTIFIAGITYYGAQDVSKLIKILNVKVPVADKSDENMITISENNIIKIKEDENNE